MRGYTFIQTALVDIFDVRDQVLLISDRVFKKLRLPDAPTLVVFLAGGYGKFKPPDPSQRRVNRPLIVDHRDEKSASPGGSVQIMCRWSGKTTHATMRNGCSAFTFPTISRNRSRAAS